LIENAFKYLARTDVQWDYRVLRTPSSRQYRRSARNAQFLNTAKESESKGTGKMADIYKIAGIVIRNKELLVTREKGEIMFFALGGKMEQGETELECLQRELSEEINCKPINPKQFQTFEGPAHNSKQSIRISCYFCEIEGEMKPGHEIEEIAWIDKNYKEKGIQLAHMLEAEIVPELVRKGLL